MTDEARRRSWSVPPRMTAKTSEEIMAALKRDERSERGSAISGREATGGHTAARKRRVKREDTNNSTKRAGSHHTRKLPAL